MPQKLSLNHAGPAGPTFPNFFPPATAETFSTQDELFGDVAAAVRHEMAGRMRAELGAARPRRRCSSGAWLTTQAGGDGIGRCIAAGAVAVLRYFGWSRSRSRGQAARPSRSLNAHGKFAMPAASRRELQAGRQCACARNPSCAHEDADILQALPNCAGRRE